MQQPSGQQYTSDGVMFSQILLRLDRLEERMESRTRDLVTRSDLEALRKELVTRDAFEPQLNALKAQITRMDADRLEDRKDLLQRVNDLETEQIGRQDRLWIRISQAVGVLAFALALFDLIMHLRFLP
jgi:hypothetical protein